MILSVSSWVWLALVVVFAMLEAGTVGLVCIWFAAGAVAALISSAITSAVPVQIVVFLVVSFAALAIT
ncbi:MAG: NfeD family protein, partial [Ruthenibacterium sp.]